MFKISDIVNRILTEATAKEIYDRYYSDIDYDIFYKIVTADPKTKVQNNELVKIGTYAKLLLKIYKSGNLLLEDLPKSTEYLSYIYKYNLPVDVRYINDLSDLYELVKVYIFKETFSVENIKKILPETEYKILLETDDWYIIYPLTQKAACYFGYGTEWCTTWGPLSLDDRFKTRRSHYAKHKNNLTIFINKKDESEKYQYHKDTNQFKNSSDREINRGDLIDQNRDIKYFFFPSLFIENKKPSKDEVVSAYMLNNTDLINFIKKLTGGRDFPIIDALMQNNEEQFMSLCSEDIKNKFNMESMWIDDNSIHIPYTAKTKRLIQNEYFLQSILNNYIWANSSYSNYECGVIELDEGLINSILLEYYIKNKKYIDATIKINSEDLFIDLFLEDIMSDRNFIEKYEQEECDKETEAYNAYRKQIATEYESCFEYDSSTISLKKLKFIEYIIDSEINEIKNVDELLFNYFVYNDINGELDYDFYHYQESLTLSDLEKAIDDYFEEQELEDDVDEKKNKNCIVTRKKFLEIKNKLFKNSNIIDNELVHLEIDPDTLDCEKETIFIRMTNKQTGEEQEGNVKIDNLSSHALNYKLFECLFRFRDLI